MIPLYSTDQVRKIDDFAINDLNIPSIVLMENAAIEIFYSILEKFSDIEFNKVGVVCGKGNNGGDGFAVARHFINNGFDVTIVYLGTEKEMSKDAQTNFTILKNLTRRNSRLKVKKYNSIKDIDLLNDCDIILEALLGTGIKGSLREPYLSIIKKINEIPSLKVAIDIPTGLDADKGYAEECFNADLTVTLGEFKKGLFFQDGHNFAGTIDKGYIGVDFSFFDQFKVSEYLIEPEDAFFALPVRETDAHKYSAGKVLTIAGSGSLPGAAAISSKASLRIGAGASILCFPKSVKELVHKDIVEVVVEEYEDNESEVFSIGNIDEIKDRLDWADVLSIGPGLGRQTETIKGVRELVKNRVTDFMVLDADAIFAISNNYYKKVDLSNYILTPHYGEFSTLIGIEISELRKDILRYGKKFANVSGAFLVLKGAPTLIFTPYGDTFINTTGNPGLAKFGSGDVLTGVIAGLLSQTKNVESAVISGVYLHSLAADILLNKKSVYGYTASDIIEELPEAIKFLDNSIV